MFATNAVLVNGKFRDGLAPADRELFDKCLQEAIDHNWRISEQADSDAKKFLLDKGLQIHEPSTEMRQAMKDSLKGFFEWFETEAPGSGAILAEMENTPK